MILRRALSTSIAFSFLLLAAMAWLGSVASAQDMSKTVLPLTQLKWVGLGAAARFGTGFCVDRECRVIGTNYHVAVAARSRKIKGEKVIHRYLATGPDDDGATTNADVAGSPMRYTLSRDLALLELRRPLPHYHGMAFSLNDLQIGQQVEIYAYPEDSLNPIRNLVQFRGAFKGETIGGLLTFDYSFTNGKAIGPGASGGLVVDRKTQQVVGVLSGIAADNEAVAVAVPIQSLAEFLSKVKPWLAQTLFPSFGRGNISATAADLYPKFLALPFSDSLQHRPAEPAEVRMLRQKAQLLSDSMRNFVAVQTVAWGSRNNEPAAVAEYEVKVLDDFQRFREYPDGKDELQNMPFPRVNTVVNPGGEWSEIPQMVGTALGLKIRQAADGVTDGRRIKVFQYRAEPEDDVCVFRSVREFGFFETSRTVTVPCYGEVWTDEELSILRVSQHLELSGKWRDYVSVVTYGWLHRANEPPRLIPLTLSTQAEFGKRVYWCRGIFTNYRIFDSQARIVTGYNVQSLPQ